MKRALAAAAPLTFALLAACGSSASDGGSAPKVEDAPAEPAASFAETVSVDDVGVYQAVKVSLVAEGERVKKVNAPVIPERPALVRVHAKALKARTKIKVAAELRVVVDGRPDAVFGAKAMTPVTLDDAELSTTFNFEVPGEAIAPGASLRVVLRNEASPEEVVSYPDDGSALPMNVGPLAPTLRVKFVPVRYDADGSGRMPDMSPGAIENYKNTLYRMYPTSRVEVAVRDDIRWPLAVNPDGNGWDQLLDALIETRSDDRVADDVYYIAVFDPAESAGAWCANGGCVLGIAPQAMLRDVYLRVAMITGYPNNEGTLAQELGHAMGRAHAPCGGAQDVDPDYPYGRANIGVFGWDIVDKDLVDPGSRVFDFMSYCHPTWVSDYTFAGLYERMVKVEQTKRPEGAEPTGGAGGAEKTKRTASVQISRVLPDGSVRPGPRVRAGDIAPDAFGFRSIAGLGGGLRIDPLR